jgi:DNA-binding beta-propeller fold protein YncE
MKITKPNTRLLPSLILNRHLLSYLAAAAIAAGTALQARAQEDNLEPNATNVPINTIAATVPLGGSPGYMVVNPKDTFVYVATYISSTSDYVISQIETTTDTVATFPLTGQPSGLAVTPNGKQLYVTLNVNTAREVAILDASAGTVVDTIDLNAGPNLLQISPDGKYAYVPVAAGGASDVIVIGVSIGYPAFAPNGKYAYVPEYKFNGTAYNYVYLMDTTTYKPVGTPIQIGNEPYFVQIAHNGRYAYVGNQLDDTVSVICVHLRLVLCFRVYSRLRVVSVSLR